MSYFEKIYKKNARDWDFVGKSACWILFIALLTIDSESNIPIITAFATLPMVTIYTAMRGGFSD